MGGRGRSMVIRREDQGPRTVEYQQSPRYPREHLPPPPTLPPSSPPPAKRARSDDQEPIDVMKNQEDGEDEGEHRDEDSSRRRYD